VTRVLLVHQPVDGGVGRHLNDVARGLTATGYEVVLCGPELPHGAPDDQHHRRLELRRAIAPRSDAVGLARFAAIVRSVDPDLIHAHSSKAGAIARLARLARPRTPVLYTPHGYAFAGYFSRERERSAYREIERVLAPLASRVVCVCEAEARLARTVGRFDRVMVVHNGVDPVGDGPTDPRMAELALRGPLLCALTQLRPGKGLETLIDALPAVLAEHPDAQVAVWGEGPDLDALRSRSRAQGVGGSVHFLGRCERPLEVLRGSHIFVHPSLAESFPYVILEAMAVGRPIVASDIGGIGEAIRDREHGLLSAPGDRDALARSLSALLDDDAFAMRIGQAARVRLEERFTKAAMIERLTVVYEDVLAASHWRP